MFLFQGVVFTPGYPSVRCVVTHVRPSMSSRHPGYRIACVLELTTITGSKCPRQSDLPEMNVTWFVDIVS